MIDKPISRYQTFFYIAILVGLLVFSLLIVKPFLTVIVLTSVAAIILHPVYERLARSMKNFRGLAALITILLVALIVLAILFFVGSRVFNEALKLYNNLQNGGGTYQSLTLDIQNKVNSFLPTDFAININSYLSLASAWIIAHFGALFSNALDLGVKIFLSAIALFYLLKDGPRITNVIENRSPLPLEYTKTIAGAFVRTIRTILLGSLTVAVVQGTLATIGFLIFGLPNPFLIGIVTAFAALLPTVGTSVVIIPAVLFLFFTGHTVPAIGLLIWGLMAVGLVDNLLSPKLIERGIKIHPLIILFSVLGGISFFGPEGFLLGPLVLSLLFTLFNMYHVFINYETTA